MRFVIVGPGAMGTLFGAALAGAGHAVTMLGHPSAAFSIIQKSGLHLQSIDGESRRVDLPVTAEPRAVATADALVVLVKTCDTANALAPVRPYLRPETTVLTFQNGLGNASAIRSALGENARVLPGITSQAALRRNPGHVIHTGTGPTLIGFDRDADAPVAEQFARVLTDAGLPAAAVPDIERWIWQKVAVNAAINGLTALGGFPNGTIAVDPALLDAAETIADEAASVARALGYELGGMRRILLETARATANNRSSMLQDLDAGRATEVDAIHGAIQTEAASVGIATPAIDVVAALIRANVRDARTKGMPRAE